MAYLIVYQVLVSRLQQDTKRSESHFYFCLSLHQNKETLQHLLQHLMPE